MALVTLCLKLRVCCLPAPVEDRVDLRVVGIATVTSGGFVKGGLCFGSEFVRSSGGGRAGYEKVKTGQFTVGDGLNEVSGDELDKACNANYGEPWPRHCEPLAGQRAYHD